MIKIRKLNKVKNEIPFYLKSYKIQKTGSEEGLLPIGCIIFVLSCEDYGVCVDYKILYKSKVCYITSFIDQDNYLENSFEEVL